MNTAWDNGHGKGAGLKSIVEAQQLGTGLAMLQGTQAAAAPTQAAATQPSLLGVSGPGLGHADALTQARALLGLGASAPARQSPQAPPVGLGSASMAAPPGLAVPMASPAAPPDGTNDVLERLVATFEGRNRAAAAPSGALFGLGGDAATTVPEYGAALGPFAVGSGLGQDTRPAAGAAGSVMLERLLATRRQHLVL